MHKIKAIVKREFTKIFHQHFLMLLYTMKYSVFFGIFCCIVVFSLIPIFLYRPMRFYDNGSCFSRAGGLSEALTDIPSLSCKPPMVVQSPISASE